MFIVVLPSTLFRGGVQYDCLRFYCNQCDKDRDHFKEELDTLLADQMMLTKQNKNLYDTMVRQETVVTSLSNEKGTLVSRQGKFQLLPPAPPYYPFPRGKIHTRGNIWSFTVG